MNRYNTQIMFALVFISLQEKVRNQCKKIYIDVKNKPKAKIMEWAIMEFANTPDKVQEAVSKVSRYSNNYRDV